jgi:raffinose/stachyose/melibiose transport system substrate-binding protein
MKFRKSVGIAVVGLAVFALAACAGGASTGQQGGAGDSNSVTFDSWSPVQQTTDQMVASFEKANPGKKIKANVFNAPDYVIDLQTRASTNTMPDVMGLHVGAEVQQYRTKLLPLQKCAADTWGDDWQSKFYPIGIDQARLGNPEGDENFYSLPILTQTVNMWANSEILEANGLAVPKTWDELVQTTKDLAGQSFAPFMLPAGESWVRDMVFMQIVNNVEPGLIYKAEDGSDSWTNPQVVKAFEYWGKLFTDRIAQPGALSLMAYPDAANQFEAGNAAMIPLGAWWIQQSDPTRQGTPDLSYGLKGFEPFLFPTIPGGASDSQLVGGVDVALGISKDTKNPKLACKVLTDFIAGDSAQVLMNTLNDLPAVIGLAPKKFTSDKQKKIYESLTNDWMPKVAYARYLKSPETDSGLGDVLSAIGAGQMTPQQAAEQMQSIQDKVNKK